LTCRWIVVGAASFCPVNAGMARKRFLMLQKASLDDSGAESWTVSCMGCLRPVPAHILKVQDTPQNSPRTLLEPQKVHTWWFAEQKARVGAVLIEDTGGHVGRLERAPYDHLQAMPTSYVHQLCILEVFAEVESANCIIIE